MILFMGPENPSGAPAHTMEAQKVPLQSPINIGGWAVFMGVDVAGCVMEETDWNTAENLTEFSHRGSSCPEKLHQCYCMVNLAHIGLLGEK